MKTNDEPRPEPRQAGSGGADSKIASLEADVDALYGRMLALETLLAQLLADFEDGPEVVTAAEAHLADFETQAVAGGVNGVVRHVAAARASLDGIHARLVKGRG